MERTLSKGHMSIIDSAKKALSSLKKEAQRELSQQDAISKKYGHIVSTDYTMAGGQPVNLARKAQQALQQHSLPGQNVAGFLADSHDTDPTNVARAKVAAGQEISEQDKDLLGQAGTSLVAGIASPLNAADDILTPGTRAFQDLGNDVYQLHLSRNRGYMTPKGQIDLDAIGKVEELANQLLPKQVIKNIQKTVPPGQRTDALLDELQVLTQ